MVVFGLWLFDVAAAARILRDVPRPARPPPVMPWARALLVNSGIGVLPGLEVGGSRCRIAPISGSGAAEWPQF
jgi:hypothetical protein